MLSKSEAEMLNRATEQESLVGLVAGLGKQRVSFSTGTGGERLVGLHYVTRVAPKLRRAPCSGCTGSDSSPCAPLGDVALTGKRQGCPSPSRKMGRNTTFCKVP